MDAVDAGGLRPTDKKAMRTEFAAELDRLAAELALGELPREPRIAVSGG